MSMTDATETNWSDALTAAERIRKVALTLGAPRTTNWIASEAAVAHETAHKYLTRLVEDGKLVAEQRDGQTTYRPDPVGNYLAEMRDLYESHTPEELASSLADMNDQIRTWKETYEVETPNKLRASLTDAESEADERERREIAQEWEHLRTRQSLVKDALSLYDRFPNESHPASA
jgi:polyhydroxyalkanoate synthesis regulator phasin